MLKVCLSLPLNFSVVKGICQNYRTNATLLLLQAFRIENK